MKKTSCSPNKKLKGHSARQVVSERKDTKGLQNIRTHRTLSFASQIFTVKLGPLQNEKHQEKEPRKQKQIVFDDFQNQQLLSERVPSQPTNPTRNSLENQKRKNQKITLYNLEKYIRESWQKRPVNDLQHFYFRCKKFFELLDSESQQYVNLNKKWCSNLFKKLQNKKYNQQETKKNEDEPKSVSETFYEMLSEPQSLQMEITISNTSQVWRRHTLKILDQNYSLKKSKLQNQNEMYNPEVIVINQKMKKTLENRKAQLNRLQNDFLGVSTIQSKYLKFEEDKGANLQNSDYLQNKPKKIPNKKIYTFEEMRNEEKAAFCSPPREINMQLFKKSELMKNGPINCQQRNRGGI